MQLRTASPPPALALSLALSLSACFSDDDGATTDASATSTTGASATSTTGASATSTGGETESASGSGSASAGTTGGVIDPEVEALCAAAEGSIVEGLTTQCECEVAAGNFADVDACLADLGFDPQVACTCAIMATYPQGPHFECLGPVTADFATCMKTTGCDDLDALDLCFFTLLDAGDCPDSDQAAEAQVRFECYGDAPFACGSGETIPETWVCDLDDNCADGSDESRCPVFMCKSGDEIPLEWQCDGAADCPDGDDEENCP